MRTILIVAITTPLIYLVIAFALTYFPFARTIPEEGLDFDVMGKQDFSLDAVEETHYLARDKTELFYRYIAGKSDVWFILMHGSGSEGRF